MAKSDNVLGVDKIEIGTPGDGVMGSSLTEFPNVELNSLNFSGGEANEETISTEGADSYLTLAASATAPTMQFRLYEVFGADAVLLLGGAYASDQYDAPNTVPDKYLSIRVTSKPIDGFYFEIEFPYARIAARHDGNITKNALLAIQVNATANTPVSAAQVEGPVYSIRKVAV